MKTKAILAAAAFFIVSVGFATPTEPKNESTEVLIEAPALNESAVVVEPATEAKNVLKSSKKELKQELKAAKQELKKGNNKKNRIESNAEAKGDKSQLVALLLAFFLGGLGIHRFYLGYTWQGVVQLLTGGGCGIWSLIDFIRIIIGTLKPKGGEYAKTL